MKQSPSECSAKGAYSLVWPIKCHGATEDAPVNADVDGACDLAPSNTSNGNALSKYSASDAYHLVHSRNPMVLYRSAHGPMLVTILHDAHGYGGLAIVYAPIQISNEDALANIYVDGACNLAPSKNSNRVPYTHHAWVS
jgi:hypothetical protein